MSLVRVGHSPVEFLLPFTLYIRQKKKNKKKRKKPKKIKEEKKTKRKKHSMSLHYT